MIIKGEGNKELTTNLLNNCLYLDSSFLFVFVIFNQRLFTQTLNR